jgi:hypothetical protein
MGFCRDFELPSNPITNFCFKPMRLSLVKAIPLKAISIAFMGGGLTFEG